MNFAAFSMLRNTFMS